MAKLRMVTCPQCGLPLDRNVEEYEKVGQKYLHLECYIIKNGLAFDPGKENFNAYVKELFGARYSECKTLIDKQVKAYLKDKEAIPEYTYDNITKTLKYAYEIKKEDINKAKGIGIVPYLRLESEQYYYNLNNLINKNKAKLSSIGEIETIDVYINSPQQKQNKSPFFAFLDEEESNEQF